MSHLGLGMSSANSTDSRNLLGGKNGCFVALKGHFRSGEQFIESAYQKNVRVFISSQIPALIHPDAVYLIVEQPLKALQLIASMHRKTITCPVVAIAGKNGKTTVKEWVYELIKSKFHVVRSPKSYNSQVGVPCIPFQGFLHNIKLCALFFWEVFFECNSNF